MAVVCLKSSHLEMGGVYVYVTGLVYFTRDAPISKQAQQPNILRLQHCLLGLYPHLNSH
jgi:hypothetical protein